MTNADPAFSGADHALMARALRLAARGLFTTHPNPHVGCVIVRDGAIVGEGWHQRAGEPHAEVFALRAAGERARGATAYVTLEPCAHRGRTPPCADALLAAGVARVVMAAEDTNPRAGGGAARLRAAGVAVESGLMRAAARELNRGFFSRFERGRPWVRVKLAMSVDGRTALANGDSKWITGEPARADVARWRARSSAILTGAGTTRADNPRLTVRLRAEVPSPAGRGCREAAGEGSLPRSAAASTSTVPLPPAPLPGGDGRNFVPPLRVVLDARLDAVPAGANLLDGSASTLVLHAPDAVAADGRYAGVERASVALGADGRLDLPAVLHMLAARRVNELQVEAGPTLCGALLERGLVDELLLYVAPTFLGDAARALLALPPLSDMAARVHLRVIERRRIGADLRVLLRPVAAQL